MSVNSTFLSSFEPDCSDSSASVHIAMAFNVARVCLLLPLSIFILLQGYRRRRSSQTTSHVDALTYHNAALELICNLVTAAYVYGTYSDIWYLKVAGWWISWLALCGEISFHLLTCVERYLAVVHPVAYRGLRNARGVRVRNFSTGCAWLLCVAFSTAASFDGAHFSTQLLCVLVSSLLVVSFCSISVLWALVRPGPGDVGGDRERVDQLKRRAFLTIVAITGVLWFWLAGLAVCLTVGLSFQCDHLINDLTTSGYWFMMPGSLTLPLLYLHRTGHIGCRKNQTR